MSAIAVIRMSGEKSVAILKAIFSVKNLQLSKAPQIVFGKICDETGVEIDEVLVSVFKAPHSYTGEDVVEISCHGSVFIIHRLRICSRGLEPNGLSLENSHNVHFSMARWIFHKPKP
ncbi:MAG: hypothetical protein IPM92_16470 [Saprospiraceae bacterium]|nr:hypothetical protein [Saprospiraceae bacterium]